MSQTTFVAKLKPAQQRALRESVGAGPFEFRSVPHAQWSARGEGVVATLYASGKLVVQGQGVEGFQLRYLEPGAVDPCAAAGSPPAAEPAALCPTDRPIVGSDECGKGDYFGPLVVCALRVPAELRDALASGEVCDSKKLSDKKVLRLSGGLEANFEYALESLEPREYNLEYERSGNLNPMLAALHGRAIRRLARGGDVVLVDRFGNEKLVAGELKGMEIDLYQEVRAEREPAVAAASIIARASFLGAMQNLSEEYGVELRKGAGPPTDQAALEFVRMHGFDRLNEVAKLHFKNTQKLEAAHGR